MNIGQQIEHSQFGVGIITGIVNEKRIKAQFDSEEFEKIVDPRFCKGYMHIGASILSIRPDLLPVEFLNSLLENKDQVEIRIHYPKHAESYVFELFSREGIELPDDIRPLASGSRGGTTIQRTLAGEMWFPENGQTRKISSLATILAVLKAGFSVTKYTKVEEKN